MRYLAIIGLALYLFIRHPALFAWNATGAVTLLVFSGLIAFVTFRRR